MDIPEDIQLGFAKHLLRGISTGPEKEKLNTIGNQLYKTTQYGNIFVVDDALSKAYLNLALISYYQCVTPLIQIESSIFLSKEFCLEYSHAIAIRSFIELAARVHKGICVFEIYQKERNSDEFHNKTNRLIQKFIPGGGGGFNILTLVNSLADMVPDVEKYYEELSEYLHGSFTPHALNRRMSYWENLKGETSSVIKRHELILDQVRKVVFSDLDRVIEITKPFADKVDNYQKSN